MDRETEYDLIRKHQCGHAATLALQSIGVLSVEGAERLREDQRVGDVAITTLLSQYRRFITGFAAHFTRRFDVSMDDQIQWASIAFVEAVRRFECERGFKFITYATSFVRGRMFVASKKNTLIHVPFYIDRKSEMFKNLQKMSSLDASTVEFDHNAPLVNILLDDAPEVIDAMVTAEDLDHLAREMKRLPRRQRYIIQRRLEGVALIDIGAELGCTRECVRLNEQQALRKLRSRLCGIELEKTGYVKSFRAFHPVSWRRKQKTR